MTFTGQSKVTKKEIKDLELKKHVGSIHCSNTLSLLQRKISNVLLYHAYDELLEREEHVIAIKKLCMLIDYSSHDYATIKKALKALISTVLEWNLLGDAKGNTQEDWNASSILSSVGIKGGICTYSYSTRLKKLLYMPEIYGRINITIQSKFKSNYALALYENCIRYQNLPYTRWFALATFRKLMGVPEKKYVIFRDFKRRVLDKSVAEINAHADILVEPEIERTGHQVNRVRFKITSRTLEQSNQVQEIYKDKSVLDDLIKQGLSKSQALKQLSAYNETYVKDTLNYIKGSSLYKNKKIENVAAYLNTALQQDYGHCKAKASSFVSTSQFSEELVRKAYADYISESIDFMLDELSDDKQHELQQKFEQFLIINNNKFVLEKYYAKGLSNRIVKSIFRVFIKENHVDLVDGFKSYEDFVSMYSNAHNY